MKDPGTQVRTVALPVDQVLPTAAPATGVYDPANGEGRVTINVRGGWRGVGRRAKWTGDYGSDLGHMERRVNPEGRRQGQTDSGWTDYLGHLVRTYKP